MKEVDKKEDKQNDNPAKNEPVADTSTEKVVKSGSPNKLYWLVGIMSLVIVLLLIANIYFWINDNDKDNSSSDQSSTTTEEVSTESSSQDTTSSTVDETESTSSLTINKDIEMSVSSTGNDIQDIVMLESVYAKYMGGGEDIDPKYKDYLVFQVYKVIKHDGTYEIETYLLPKSVMQNVTLVKQDFYNLKYSSDQVQYKEKDNNAVVYYLTQYDSLDDTSLKYIASGVFKRHAGDEWGAKYNGDDYLDYTNPVDGTGKQMVYFIPVTVSEKLGLNKFGMYQILFQYSDDDIQDPDLTTYIVSGKAIVITDIE